MHNEHMTKSALPKPIIIDLPYQSIDDKAEIEKAFVEQLGYETLSAVERETLHYIGRNFKKICRATLVLCGSMSLAIRISTNL